LLDVVTTAPFCRVTVPGVGVRPRTAALAPDEDPDDDPAGGSVRIFGSLVSTAIIVEELSS
jgi:hypothetical protein